MNAYTIFGTIALIFAIEKIEFSHFSLRAAFCEVTNSEMANVMNKEKVASIRANLQQTNKEKKS